MSGDFFLGGVIAGALTKLVLRQRQLGDDEVKLNHSCADAMLIITSILRLGESPVLAHPADTDSVDRMTTCLQVSRHYPPKSST